jgi:hypothetical protein
MRYRIFLFVLMGTAAAWCQSTGVKDIGSGAATIGKGTAGAVGNLATGHPVNAAASLGKGVGKGGTRVAIGAGKGAYKVSKGVGVGLKKLTHL